MVEPKYLQIENELKEEILSGQFQYADKFYSEKELKDKFNVSSITVIRSVKDLVKAGYLVRYQGKGTFVSHFPHQRLVRYQELNRFPNKESANKESIKVLSLEKEDDADINRELGINKNTFHYHLTQVRSVNNEPFLYYQAYFAPKFINYRKLKDLQANFQNIYVRIREDSNIYLLDEPFKEKDSVVNAPKEVANALNLSDDAYVVKQEKKIVSSKNAEVLLYRVNYKKVDYTEVSFTTPDYPEI